MVQQNSIFVLAMAQRCTLSDTLIIIIRNIRAFRDQTLQYPFQPHEAGHRVLENKGAMAETRILPILRSSQRARSLCIRGARDYEKDSGTMSKNVGNNR